MKKTRSGPVESGGGCRQTLTSLNQLMMWLELQTNITSNGNGDGSNDNTRRNNYPGPLTSGLFVQGGMYDKALIQSSAV